MTDFIIVAVLVLVVAYGIYSTVKHFQRRSGCCGSADYKPKKKKLSGVMYQKTFKVEGMHCDHCKIRVEEIVNDMKGVAGKVDLKKGELVVSYAEDVEDEQIKSRIERVGYRVTDIRK